MFGSIKKKKKLCQRKTIIGERKKYGLFLEIVFY